MQRTRTADKFHSRLLRGAVPIIAGFVLSSPAWAAYTLTDLGNHGDGYTDMVGITNSGLVIGYAVDANGPYWGTGFLYNANDGSMSNLTAGLQPLAINDNGAVYLHGAAGAYVYQGGTYSSVVPGGASINGSGVIAGSRSVSGCCTNHAMLNTNGSLTDLGTLGGATSLATDINNNGQVVGESRLSTSFASHAFLYENGLMRDLTPLAQSSSAASINDLGQVVGTASRAANVYESFLYSGGTLTYLDALGTGRSEAYDINDQGQILGRYEASKDEWTPYIYMNGEMLDLNDLLNSSGAGWVLLYAGAINDLGQIVGLGALNGQVRGFVLTPDGVTLPVAPSVVPVPAAAWLFGSALVGLAGFGRKKRG